MPNVNPVRKRSAKTVCPFAKTFYSTLEKLGQLLFVNALNYNKNMVI